MLTCREYSQDGVKVEVHTVRGDDGTTRVFVQATVIDPFGPESQSSWATLEIPMSGYQQTIDCSRGSDPCP